MIFSPKHLRITANQHCAYKIIAYDYFKRLGDLTRQRIFQERRRLAQEISERPSGSSVMISIRPARLSDTWAAPARWLSRLAGNVPDDGGVDGLLDGAQKFWGSLNLIHYGHVQAAHEPARVIANGFQYRIVVQRNVGSIPAGELADQSSCRIDAGR